MYHLRKLEARDLDTVERMLVKAKTNMREVLHIDQWQNGYPSRCDFEKDIAQGKAYAYCDEADIPVGIATVTAGKDPVYDAVSDGNGEFFGKWRYEDRTAAAVHRFCVAQERTRCGVGTSFMQALFGMLASRGVQSVRIDTHRYNVSMRRMLQKCGFQEIGVVYVQELTPERIAYERLLPGRDG